MVRGLSLGIVAPKFLGFGQPWWLKRIRFDEPLLTVEEQVRKALELARLNAIVHGTGLPFAGFIIDRQNGKVIDIAVDQSLHCPFGHAAAGAIWFALRELDILNLGLAVGPKYRLVVTGEPCDFCKMAIRQWRVRDVVFAAHWANIQKNLAIAADSILDLDWLRGKENDTIVTGGVLEEESCALLREYRDSGRHRMTAKKATV